MMRKPPLILSAALLTIACAVAAGDQWKAVNAGLLDASFGISLVAIDPATPSTLYAVTNIVGLYRSADSAASWQAVRGLSSVTFLALDPQNSGTLYAVAFTASANMRVARADHTATLLNNGQVLITGGTGSGSSNSISGISSAELYTSAVLVPAPMLFSVSGDGRAQGAIWHATTGEIASPENPAMTGEALSMYATNLAGAGVIPPQVAVGGRLADVIYFGLASGYAGYYQQNFRAPDGIAMSPSVSVRLTYLGRSSNRVTIGVQ